MTHEVNSPRVMAERSLFAVWLAYFVASVVALLCGVEYILLAKFVARESVQVLFWQALAFGLLNAPLATYLRRLGDRHAHFREHEASLDGMFYQPPSSFTTLAEFVRAIEGSTGWARQEIRNAAEAWLTDHHRDLSEEEREYAEEHLPYLLPRGWKREGRTKGLKD